MEIGQKNKTIHDLISFDVHINGNQGLKCVCGTYFLSFAASEHCNAATLSCWRSGALIGWWLI